MSTNPESASVILADFSQQCDDLQAVLFLGKILTDCETLNKFLEQKDLNPSIRVRVRIVNIFK